LLVVKNKTKLNVILCTFIQAKSIKTSPDPSRNKPSRHENGTTVSACANRSLAFSKLPGACLSTEAIQKVEMGQRITYSRDRLQKETLSEHMRTHKCIYNQHGDKRLSQTT